MSDEMNRVFLTMRKKQEKAIVVRRIGAAMGLTGLIGFGLTVSWLGAIALFMVAWGNNMGMYE